MLDFSTLKTLTIPEGKATRISKGSEDIVWESPIASFLAEKITANTYDKNTKTSYTDEHFLLIDVDIAPYGTIIVNYAGYEKIESNNSEKNIAVKIFFGTYLNITDDFATPDSGILTIEGDYVNYKVGVFNTAKSTTKCCGCITKINSFGKITRINGQSFANCNKITEIILPKTITEIQMMAFENCTSLIRAVLPGVLKFGSGCFNNCESLNSIIFMEKEGLDITGNPFARTAWLDNFINNNQFAYINECLIDGSGCIGSITIPDNIKKISNGAFQNNENITEISLPKYLDYIGQSAFYNCSSLKVIEFQNTSTLKELKEQTFRNCTSLQLLRTYFNNNNNIKTDYLPTSIEKLENYCFYNCPLLFKLFIHSNINFIGYSALQTEPDSIAGIMPTFEDPNNWYISETEDGERTLKDLTNVDTTWFNNLYCKYYWFKEEG